MNVGQHTSKLVDTLLNLLIFGGLAGSIWVAIVGLSNATLFPGMPAWGTTLLGTVGVVAFIILALNALGIIGKKK